MSQHSHFDATSHLEQARFNEQLARSLLSLGANCGDWIITLCFYSALHYANSKKRLPENHHDTINFIPRQFGVPAYKAYKPLYDKSFNARYRPAIAKKYRQGIKKREEALKTLEEFKRAIGTV